MANKTMCKLASKGKLDKIAKLANKPQYICENCGRAANEDKALCKPRKM